MAGRRNGPPLSMRYDDDDSLIIFNSPINGRRYKKTTQKKRKAVTTVTIHIDLTTQYQTQAMTIY